jgi:hypothetical protein
MSPNDNVAQAKPPDTGFPFRRLLRLTEIRWRYSDAPEHGDSGAIQVYVNTVQSRRPEFNSWSVFVGFVVIKVALETVFFEYFLFETLCQFIIHFTDP